MWKIKVRDFIDESEFAIGSGICRVEITSLSRVRDGKFTEMGLNFLYRVL
jgi:hypothetical protein